MVDPISNSKTVVSNTTSKSLKESNSATTTSSDKVSTGSDVALKADSILSPELDNLVNLSRIFAADPPIETEEVDKLKLDLANGTYSVDVDAIVEKILSPYSDVTADRDENE